MQKERPYVLTVAGFDPCCGAGLTADIKTFEQLKVYGLAVCTSLTLQTEDNFISASWREVEDVRKEIEVLLKQYPVKAIKFGIVPSFEYIKTLVASIKNLRPDVQIVVDPVWKASSGFNLNNNPFVLDKDFLEQITLFTPNLPELQWMSSGNSTSAFISELISHTNILVKGGHRETDPGIDTLYTKNGSLDLVSFELDTYAKHGSGCVLSAAITAYLAHNNDLTQACISAKSYIDKFLNSSKSLLGYHTHLLFFSGALTVLFKEMMQFNSSLHVI
jgi:hydroxymethylpyrimidine/phosphomethylpyrimidine kinase